MVKVVACGLGAHFGRTTGPRLGEPQQPRMSTRRRPILAAPSSSYALRLTEPRSAVLAVRSRCALGLDLCAVVSPCTKPYPCRRNHRWTQMNTDKGEAKRALRRTRNDSLNGEPLFGPRKCFPSVSICVYLWLMSFYTAWLRLYVEFKIMWNRIEKGR